MDRLTPLRRRVRRAVLARRRPLAALAAATAVAAGLQVGADPPPATTRVLTAARDLPSGRVLAPTDLAAAAYPPEHAPDGSHRAATTLLGRTLAAPLRAGEPVTDVRLVTGTLLEGYPGLVAAPVRVGDPGAVALLDVGDRVDVLAADPQGREAAAVVAAGARVAALPRSADATPVGVQGGLVVLALSESEARDVAAAGVSRYLSVVITQ